MQNNVEKRAVISESRSALSVDGAFMSAGNVPQSAPHRSASIGRKMNSAASSARTATTGGN